MSKPLGTAEVIYGVDGVCHQTANRILLPAKTRVDAARGYNVSLWVYGDYGVRWPNGRVRWMQRLATCTAQQPASVLHADYDDVTQQRVAGKGSDMANILPAHEDATPNMYDLVKFMESGTDTASEMDRLFENVAELSGEEKKLLLDQKLRFHSIQAQLVQALEDGTLDKRSYLRETNVILRSAMQQNKQILGEERFHAVFGDQGLEPEGLIDEAVFLADR